MQVKKANWFILGIVVLPFLYLGLRYVLPVELPLWLQLMMGELLILVCIIGYCLVSKVSLRQTIPHKSLNVSTILLIVVFTWLTSPLITVVNLLSQFLVPNTAAATMDVVQGMPFWLLFFIMVLMPTFIEEIGFRGILLQNYRESGVWRGILLSALLFGLMHMNLNQMLYATVLGIIMGLLVEATNSIFSAMLMHFLINGSNVLMVYQQMQTSTASATELYESSLQQLGISHQTLLVIMVLVYGIFAVFGTALAIPVYKGIASASGRAGYISALFKGNVRPYEKQKIVTIPLVLAIVCSVIYIVVDTILQMQL